MLSVNTTMNFYHSTTSQGCRLNMLKKHKRSIHHNEEATMNGRQDIARQHILKCPMVVICRVFSMCYLLVALQCSHCCRGGGGGGEEEEDETIE